jgi:hypothetical protein
MSRSAMSRRAFLRGAGGVMVGLPYLDFFAGRARAQSAAPMRLVVMMHGQGMLMDRWTPSSTGAGFTLTETLQPLAAHRDKLLVLSGIDNAVRNELQEGNGHNTAGRSLMTCWGFAGSTNADGTIKPAGEQVENGPSFGPSVEQVLAERLAGSTRFNRFDVAIGGNGVGENQLFWAENQVPIQAEADPVAAYARLTNEIAPSAATAQSFADRLRSRRTSVLDSVLGSFDRLSSQVGADDRARLEAHATQLRALENRLVVGPSAGCMPQAPQLPAGYDFERAGDDYLSATAQIDNLVLALSCDLARVGTVQFTDYHGPTFPWLDVDVPGPWANWHEMIHSGMEDAASRATMIKVQQWYASQFAYLLDRMDAVVEADGNTLLDNSLVMWITEFGDASSHSTGNLPIVLAGGLGGRVQMGRHLNFNNRTTGDLFTTFLQLFGYDDSSFGMLRRANGNPLVTGAIDLG